MNQQNKQNYSITLLENTHDVFINNQSISEYFTDFKQFITMLDQEPNLEQVSTVAKDGTVFVERDVRKSSIVKDNELGINVKKAVIEKSNVMTNEKYDNFVKYISEHVEKNIEEMEAYIEAIQLFEMLRSIIVTCNDDTIPSCKVKNIIRILNECKDLNIVHGDFYYCFRNLIQNLSTETVQRFETFLRQVLIVYDTKLDCKDKIDEILKIKFDDIKNFSLVLTYFIEIQYHPFKELVKSCVQNDNVVSKIMNVYEDLNMIMEDKKNAIIDILKENKFYLYHDLKFGNLDIFSIKTEFNENFGMAIKKVTPLNYHLSRFDSPIKHLNFNFLNICEMEEYDDQCYEIIYPKWDLLIYREGDYFKKHIDNKINKRHLVTLLLFPPKCINEFTGGDLLLHSEYGTEVVSADQYCWKLVALPPNVFHECTPVTLGVRCVFKTPYFLQEDDYDKFTTDHYKNEIFTSTIDNIQDMGQYADFIKKIKNSEQKKIHVWLNNFYTGNNPLDLLPQDFELFARLVKYLPDASVLLVNKHKEKYYASDNEMHPQKIVTQAKLENEYVLAFNSKFDEITWKFQYDYTEYNDDNAWNGCQLVYATTFILILKP